ncbi:hypothetical protein [Prevotellamassilia timonensis]|uniref:hypothetical protein n=1 Tax=Prevotellamassilia timonensis TaxID=1852370 RepID=UPI003A9376AB
MINKVYKTSNLIPKLLIAVTSIFCISSCGKVKNEPVKVIQTGSFSNALVIQVNKIGKYSVYIPNDTVRPKFAKLVSLKAFCGDSIWEIKLSEISNAFDAYKDITKSKDLQLKIEADRNAEYLPIKNLMKCLQDAGYTQPYNLTTKP